MMKKIIYLLSVLLLAAACTSAQSTTVSGTITDSGGQAWFAGTISFLFRPAASNPTAQYMWNGAPFSSSTTIPSNPLTLDGTGSFSGLSIPSNTAIAPAGSQWAVTVCPAATVPSCYTQLLTISGSTLNISSQVVPPPVVVNFSVPLIGARAYTDAEVVGASPGVSYFNVTDETLHVCLQTGFPPCTWTSIPNASSTVPVTTLNVNITPVTVTGTTSTTPSLMTYTFAAGSLNAVGKSVRIEAHGVAIPQANNTAVCPTFTLITISNPVSSTCDGAVATSGGDWNIVGTCTTKTAGTNGILLCQITYGVGPSANAALAVFEPQPSQWGNPFGTLNLTVAQTLTIGWTWGTGNNSNTVTENNLYVQALN
jgi:hypothetical protein